MEKYFIFKLKNWFIGFYRGTLPELAAALKTIDTYVKESVDIDEQDLMLVFNKEIKTTTMVFGYNKELQQEIAIELRRVFESHEIKPSKGHIEKMSEIARLECHWHPSEFYTDVLSILVSDGDKRMKPNTIYIGGREFKSLSEFSADDFWARMRDSFQMYPFNKSKK